MAKKTPKKAKAGNARKATALPSGTSALPSTNEQEPTSAPEPVAIQQGPGRPTKYRPEFVKQAEALCNLGATDEEMASFFEVDTSTLHRWKLEYPEFCDSIKAGKSKADDRVERSLYNRAVGYTYDSEKIVTLSAGPLGSSIERVPIVEHVPPDTTAMIFWLKNRRKGEWRDKQEVELSGKVKKVIRFTRGGKDADV